jgi:hypothetical protein
VNLHGFLFAGLKLVGRKPTFNFNLEVSFTERLLLGAGGFVLTVVFFKLFFKPTMEGDGMVDFDELKLLLATPGCFQCLFSNPTRR